MAIFQSTRYITHSPRMRCIPKSLPISIRPYHKVHLHNSQPIHLQPPQKRPMTTTSIQPTFSANSDIPSLTTSLSALLHPKGRWQLTPKGNGVERTFKFKTFKKTWVCFCSMSHVCHSSWKQENSNASGYSHQLTFHETGVHEYRCGRM